MESDYPIIGQIVLFSGRYDPENWMYCEGQTLPYKGYEALVSIIGDIYGYIDGSTFTLPDLREIEPKKGTPGYGLRYIIRVKNASYPMRKE